MTPHLSVNDVSVRFPPAGRDARPAVDSVSFDLRPGEVFGIVGESGSGKSTLANAIIGLLPTAASVNGSITFEGQELLGLGEDALRHIRGNRIAMIFQDPTASLDPTWPAGDQIAEAIRAHHKVSRREARERSIELMRDVGIADAAQRYGDVPHRFSGGMRQRVVIAAALANNPGLLIADEPTTALDVTIQAQVLQLIDRMLREHGTTVLLITHDLSVVAQICDRIGVMYGGALLEVASKADMFTRPSHPYTRALLAADPSRAPRGQRLPVIPPEWSTESLLRAETVRDGAAAAEKRHG